MEREARLKMEGCREMVSELCWLLQWSSAAPAARPRPRQQMKKQLKKHGTNFETELKNSPGAIPEPTDSRDEPKAPQKVAERAHRQPKRAKGTQKDDTRTPKETTTASKGCQKRPQGLPKNTKNDEKNMKKRDWRKPVILGLGASKLPK